MINVLQLNTSIDGRGDSYLARNPDWHVKDSPWKAKMVLQMLDRHHLPIKSVGEIGCGAGEVLNQLVMQITDRNVYFAGFDIAEEAIEICKTKANERLTFQCCDLLQTTDVYFDLLLALDVLEHVEDCFGFARALGNKARYKMYHFPLELSVSTIMRNNLMKSRNKVGHLHFFTKDTALALLKDAGQQVVDYFYTPASFQNDWHWRTKLLNGPRWLVSLINQDFAAQLFGGYGLMVLTK